MVLVNMQHVMEGINDRAGYDSYKGSIVQCVSEEMDYVSLFIDVRASHPAVFFLH
jgi:hypothetical protein